MEPQAKAERVILLHAAVVGSSSLNLFGRRLSALGFEVLIPPYPNRRLDVEGCARHLLPLWRKLASQAAPAYVHLAGHSLGGLVARKLISLHQPANLGRLVTLGTPHLGSPLADFFRRFAFYHKLFGPVGEDLTTGRDIGELCPWPPPCPTGLIAGCLDFGPGTWLLPLASDGTVTRSSAQPYGGHDYALVPATHTTIPFLKRSAALTAAFFRTGSFAAAQGSSCHI